MISRARTRPLARMHALTKQNDFPGGTAVAQTPLPPMWYSLLYVIPAVHNDDHVHAAVHADFSEQNSVHVHFAGTTNSGCTSHHLAP